MTRWNVRHIRHRGDTTCDSSRCSTTRGATNTNTNASTTMQALGLLLCLLTSTLLSEHLHGELLIAPVFCSPFLACLLKHCLEFCLQLTWRNRYLVVDPRKHATGQSLPRFAAATRVGAGLRVWMDTCEEWHRIKPKPNAQNGACPDAVRRRHLLHLWHGRGQQPCSLPKQANRLAHL